MLEKKISENIQAHIDLLSLEPQLKIAINKMTNCLRNGSKIMICGNGGSAADAQHLAAEFLIRLRPKINRKAMPVISLAQDTSTITACGNDYSFENIFSRTFEALNKRGDILIVISTSGKSKNILNVLKTAKKKNIFSIALLGSDGGVAKKLAKLPIIVNNKVTARIQECHIFLGHHIFEEVENSIFDIK